MKIAKDSCFKLSDVEIEYLFGLIVKQELPGWERLEWDDEFKEWELRGRSTICLHRNGLIIYQCQNFFKLGQVYQAGQFFVDHDKPASMPWAYDSYTEDPNCRAWDEHLCNAVAICMIRSRFGLLLSRQPHGYPEIDFTNKKSPTKKRRKVSSAAPPVRRRRRRSV